MSNKSNKDRYDGIILQNGRYKKEFEETKTPIGIGSFGLVFKAKNLIDDKEYAIKKIKISSYEDFKKKREELKVWAKLDCDYFVQYRSSWVEIYDQKLFLDYWESLKTIEDTTSEPDEIDPEENPIHAFLHIQMDLCLFTLREAMNKVNEELYIGKGQILNPIGFYIAGELLAEILGSIDFLHKQNIIHRDLKPQNILLSNGANGRFIRIADFGITTAHSGEESHTQLRGTLKYMAPEVLNSRKYDTKADIYSIGVITQEMFNININKNEQIQNEDKFLLEKYTNVINLINNSMNVVRSQRPNCHNMLAEKQKWAYSSDDIHRYYKEKNLKLATNDNFSSYFLRMKLGTYLNNVHLINKKNQEFVTGDIKTEMYSERQKSLLTELSIIGYSSKSIVFECVDENYIKYAIKLLRINENDFKNFEAVSNLISTLPLKEKDAEKILQFKKYWRRDRKFDQFEITKMKIDSNLLNHPVFISNDSLLHIQMELMPFNLKSIKEELDWKVSKNSVTLSSVKYFIACELVMEILECVSYLHARKIYHLNLKPSNILISDGINGTFIKLSDFKLGIPEENGFMKDVNSLKDIIYEIFCLNINISDKIGQNNDNLLEKFEFIENKIKNSPPEMDNDHFWCKNMLKEKSSWTIDIRDDIKNEKIYHSIIESNFLSFVVKKKCGIIDDSTSWLSFMKNPCIDKHDNDKKNEYEREFDELNVIGYGTFSIVFSIQRKSNGEKYALKRMPIKKEFIKNIQREVEFLSKSKTDVQVVKYYSSWTEENELWKKISKKHQNVDNKHLFFTSKDPILNIQMEFCPKTLRDLIEEIKIDMSRSEMMLNILDYSICSILFKNLLQCVDFLHKEQVIHRDLKPTNIMISDDSKGNFIKLGDFGLVKLHEYENQSHTKGAGSTKYMAPERWTTNYNLKADIYSLGVIMIELFHIQKNFNLNVNSDSNLVEMYHTIKSISKKMKSEESEKRPYCHEVLSEQNQWLPEIEIFRKMKLKCQKNESISKSSNGNFYVKVLQNQIRLSGLSQSQLTNSLGEFKKEYKNITFFKKGSYSVVFNVKTSEKMETKVIKFIPLKLNKIEEVKQELENTKSLNASYVDTCNSFIFENNYLKELFEDIFDSKENERLIEDDDIESFFSKYKHVLRLEMEYYPYTLMDVLNHLKSEFEPLKENFIPTIWFYIATQLFFEIIECLDYLHKNKIIHRDLKPTNILISNNFTNRYVKLTDIGILKAFPWKVTMSNSLKMDTAKYIDPVSLKDEYFGEEINIFSLGKIMLEFFNLKDDKAISENNDERILKKYCEIKDLCCAMVRPKRNLRPKCQELLERIKPLMIEMNEICDETKVLLTGLDANGKHFDPENLKFHERFVFEKSRSNGTIK